MYVPIIMGGIGEQSRLAASVLLERLAAIGFGSEIIPLAEFRELVSSHDLLMSEKLLEAGGIVVVYNDGCYPSIFAVTWSCSAQQVL